MSCGVTLMPVPRSNEALCAWRKRYHRSAASVPSARFAAIRSSIKRSMTGPRATRSASTVNSPRPTGLMIQLRPKRPAGPCDRTSDGDCRTISGFAIGERRLHNSSIRHQPRAHQARTSRSAPLS